MVDAGENEEEMDGKRQRLSVPVQAGAWRSWNEEGKLTKNLNMN